MTSNQINYMRGLEEQRANREKEYLTSQANAEAVRHNQQMEYEQNRANTLNYNASVYSTQASMYNAQLNAQTQRYQADLNAYTQRQRLLLDDTIHLDNYHQTAQQIEIEKEKLELERRKQNIGIGTKVGDWLLNVASKVVPILA